MTVTGRYPARWLDPVWRAEAVAWAEGPSQDSASSQTTHGGSARSAASTAHGSSTTNRGPVAASPASARSAKLAPVPLTVSARVSAAETASSAATTSAATAATDPVTPSAPADSQLGFALVDFSRRTVATTARATVPAAAAVDTGLVMGPSGVPIPSDEYIQSVFDLYIKPNSPGTIPIGLFTPEGLYPITGVKSLPLNTSVDQGITILKDAIQRQLDLGNTLTVFGYSQSAIISSLYMKQLLEQPDPPGNLNFVLVGNEMNPNGGFLSRFPGLKLPSLGLDFYGATPENAFPTANYTLEYDGFAARQATYPNWGPLQFSVPLHPTGVGEEHTLKFAVADVGPAPGGDATRDTAAFLSELEFIQCNCPPQDADADGDVDLGDFNNAFQPCFNGPNQPYKLDADVCFCMDADHDGDIDVADFLAFQGCFNGPNRPPKCTDGCTRSPDAGMMSASVELSDVVFDLYSPSSGKAIAAGTPVEWSVSVRAAGLDAAVAGCVFDLELRQDSEAGALAKVAIPPPTFATPFSDGSAVWSVSGPSNRPLGTLGGLGDAFPVPWSAESARRLAALSAETAAWLGAASWEPAALPDAGCVVSAGAIDTAGLAPGRYVLVLRPINANVLRRESDLTGALIGNFAAAARAVAGTRSVAFDIAK